METAINSKPHRRRKLGLALAVVASLPLVVWPVRGQVAGPPATTTQTTYTVIDLGTLGGTFSLAVGINNRGQVVGFSTLPGDTKVHGFLWSEGVMTDLGTLGGPNSFVFFPFNERSEIVGWSDTSTPDPLGEDFCNFGTHLICLPFLWHNGVMTALPTLGGNNGAADNINNRGQAVGGSETTTTDPTCVAPEVLQFVPVRYENGQIQQQFPTFPGDPDGFAAMINDKGQAVGQSGSCTNPFLHALLWQNGTVTDLGNLGGTTANVGYINSQGQVVGESGLPGDTTFHAFLWQNGVMTDLGTLPGDVSSAASGINSKGQIVGVSFDASGNLRAVLWQNGVMTDLNTLIPADSPLFLLFATANNSPGQITGFALQTSTGEVHAFLATPSSVGSSESAPPAARGETRESPKVTLPENVRRMLQQRQGFGRFGARLMRPR